MRKFILITAMVLASATAQAGPMRGLTLASNETAGGGRAAPKPTQTPAASRSAEICRAARGRRYGDRSAEGGDNKARRRETLADEQD